MCQLLSTLRDEDNNELSATHLDQVLRQRVLAKYIERRIKRALDAQIEAISPRDRAAIHSAVSTESEALLTAVPSSRLTTMDDSEMKLAIHTRLALPLPLLAGTPATADCCAAHFEVNDRDDHAQNCRKLSGQRTVRHNKIATVLRHSMFMIDKQSQVTPALPRDRTDGRRYADIGTLNDTDHHTYIDASQSSTPRPDRIETTPPTTPDPRQPNV